MPRRDAKDLVMKDGIKVDPIFHQRNFVYDDKLAFVLMPFSEPWSDRIWEKLKEIIGSRGLNVERADNRYGAIIMEDIWTGIMEARIVVCDTTGWNPNVFCELGIAHTIGKPTILLTQPSNRLPFDTQGLRHIIYTDNPSGMKKLEAELSSWIEHCLAQIAKIGKYRRERRRKSERPSGEDLKAAWQTNTNGYDPELPPIEHQVMRSKMGGIKKRMREYAWVLSADEIEQFLAEIKKVWPESWEDMKEEDIEAKFEEISEVVNKWRGNYRKKVR